MARMCRWRCCTESSELVMWT